MIVIAFAFFGVFLGIRSASRRGGKFKDKLQYAAVYGIALALGGLFITIALGWLAMPRQS